MSARLLFCAWKATRKSPSARELLNAVIDSADIERRYPFGGGYCASSVVNRCSMSLPSSTPTAAKTMSESANR